MPFMMIPKPSVSEPRRPGVTARRSAARRQRAAPSLSRVITDLPDSTVPMAEHTPWPGLSAVDEAGFPERWRQTLRDDLEEVFSAGRHGRWAEWQATLTELPRVSPSLLDFNADAVTIGASGDMTATERERLAALLHRLHPWRKGPFNLFGIDVDAEWRSNLKWQRVQTAIAPLPGRRILDVGSGNGYYAWRMLGAGAELVIGIDPTLVHIAQFLAVKQYAGPRPVHLLALGIER
ncbi:MAG: DUF1698 domain-containing protein, partial [Gammaproteobacteria bacterium]|nr:DUF1698 domain-containing protein [Gammaproteobacteria bacterium]